MNRKLSNFRRFIFTPTDDVWVLVCQTNLKYKKFLTIKEKMFLLMGMVVIPFARFPCRNLWVLLIPDNLLEFANMQMKSTRKFYCS